MTQDPANTPLLTREYCSAAANRLVFHPQTREEAEFIVSQLQGMGFRYYRPEYANQLQQTVSGCLYLDNDKTIMVGSNNAVDGMPCSVDGFNQFYLPASAVTADARLSPEDCQRRTLAFYPRSNAEARGVLGALLKAGVTPRDEGTNLAILMARAVVQGVLVRDGRISFAPTPAELQGAEICTAADLGICAAVSLSAEQATIMAAFNEMSARLEQMAQRIARLEEEILPKELSKTQLHLPKRQEPGR